MRDHCNGARTNWRVAVSAVLAMAAAAACGGSAAGPGGGDAGPIEPDVSFTVSAQKVLDIHGQDCLLFAASPSHNVLVQEVTIAPPLGDKISYNVGNATVIAGEVIALQASGSCYRAASGKWTLTFMGNIPGGAAFTKSATYMAP